MASASLDLHPRLAAALLVFIVATASSSLWLYSRRGDAGTRGEGSALLGPGIRAWYFDKLQPFEDWCVAHDVSAVRLTIAQLFGAALVCVAYASGFLFIGGWLLLAVGSLDIVDGRLARRTATAGARGAFLDSVVDRYADALSLIGLAVYYRSSWVLWAVLFALLGSTMVSYTRSRAESLGIDCKVGALQRPERTVLLGFGSFLAVLGEHLGAPHVAGEPYGMLVLTLLALAILTNASAAQRVLHTERRLRECER